MPKNHWRKRPRRQLSGRGFVGAERGLVDLGKVIDFRIFDVKTDEDIPKHSELCSPARCRQGQLLPELPKGKREQRPLGNGMCSVWMLMRNPSGCGNF